MRKKRKISISTFFAEAWLDLRFKLIILGSVFVSFIFIIALVVLDIQSDRELIESKANKYETYIDQLLMKKYTVEELKSMNPDDLKLAIDIVIDETNSLNANAPKLDDFILPVKDDDYSTTFKLSREPKSMWTQEDIDQFWIDLDSIDIKNLDEKNFDYLKARLKDIR